VADTTAIKQKAPHRSVPDSQLNQSKIILKHFHLKKRQYLSKSALIRCCGTFGYRLSQ
jgi:hypothetical protein